MKTFAPISISVYDRKQHLERALHSLLANPEACDTVVYIFSDAPRSGDEERVESVRKFLRSVKGFKQIRIVEQPDNNYKRNMADARRVPLAEFGRMIRMEDDIVVSNHFLEYMNSALDRYECDERIFAVSAYSPQVDFGIKSDVYLSKDFSAWGYGTWANRDLAGLLDRRDYYSRLLLHPSVCKRIESLHPYMMPMLKLIEQGKAEAGDYKASANLFLSGAYTIKPVSAMVQNTGFDGSGMGGGGRVTSYFDTSVINGFSPKFPIDLDYDERNDDILFSHYFSDPFFKIFMLKLKLKIKALLPAR